MRCEWDISKDASVNGTNKLQSAPSMALQDLTPVFTSNEKLARFYHELPEDIATNCILFFGCSRHELFGLNEEDGGGYDEFIRYKQRQRKVHLLKPTFWRPGQPCEYSEASAFFEQNGFKPLQSDMEFYEQNVRLDRLLRESRRELPSTLEGVLEHIEKNFEDASNASGDCGHATGPILEMLHLSDERLFPINGTVGLDDFLEKRTGFVSQFSVGGLYWKDRKWGMMSSEIRCANYSSKSAAS